MIDLRNIKNINVVFDKIENDCAPQFVREDFVEFVAERLARRRKFHRHGLLDFGDEQALEMIC